MAQKKKRSADHHRYPVRVSRSGIHGRGVFATRTIRRGSVIGMLTGRLFDPSDANELPSPFTCFFEGDSSGKEIALEPEWPFCFLNHCRKPNADFQVVLRALRTIRAGEEITISYGPRWR